LGAVAGAAGGATIGAFTCTTSVVAAPAAPICGAVVGLRRFRSAKKAQTITGQRVNLDL